MIVGLVGAGNMAAALALGWSAAETGPDGIVVSDLDAERAQALADAVGARTAASNRELAETRRRARAGDEAGRARARSPRRPA